MRTLENIDIVQLQAFKAMLDRVEDVLDFNQHRQLKVVGIYFSA